MGLSKNNTISMLRLFSIFFTLFTLQTQAQYKISVKIEGYTLDTCILAYQVGDKTYKTQEQYSRNKDGFFVFEGDKSLEGGMYCILIKPNNQYFNFLIPNEEEQFDLKIYTQITTNASRELSGNLRFENAPDNQLFLTYKQFLGSMKMRASQMINQIKKLDRQKDSVLLGKLTLQYDEINDKVLNYQKNILFNHPHTLTASIIKSTAPIDIPLNIRSMAKKRHYNKIHFWDNFNFNDPRLIRTTFFMNKVLQFVDRICEQDVDSVSVACIQLLNEALNGDREMFRFLAVELLNKYAETDQVCMDGVYSSIAKKFYCNGHAFWLDAAKIEKICKDAQRMDYVRCGKNAPEIRLKNIADSSFFSLYNTKANFIAIFFWDPGCSKCAKTSQALKPIYDKWKSKGLEIVGICSKPWKQKKQCADKIKDLDIKWINTSEEAYPLAYVKKFYDIRSNPVIYLLDDMKKIIYKKISAEQLDKILDYEYRQKEAD